MTEASDASASTSRGGGEYSIDEVAFAIIRHAADHFEQEINPAEVDLEMGFLDGQGMVLGSRKLDSVDTLSLFALIDDEIGVSLLDIDDIHKIDSLRKVSGYLIDTVDRNQLRSYCIRWSDPR